MKKVDIIFGTRPEAIKMAMVCKVFKASSGFETRIISTGQHREMLKPILDWFAVVPDADLDMMEPNQTLSGITAKCVSKLQHFYDTYGSPDLVLVQGDTTTAFVSALTCFYNKARIGHVEAGLRTRNKYSPWPEEMNRMLISRLADFHFCATDENVENLKAEGVDPVNIYRTGNTVIDALLYSREKVTCDHIFPAPLKALFEGNRRSARMILITGHRRENFGAGFQSICEGIKRLASTWRDVEFVYPVHLNPNVRTVVLDLLGGLQNVHLVEPLGYPEFIALMDRSYLMLTDSGGVQEEGPSLGKPVLVMRENTERPEAIIHGTGILVGTNADRIFSEVSRLLDNEQDYKSMTRIINPYGDGKSSCRIYDAIVDLL